MPVPLAFADLAAKNSAAVWTDPTFWATADEIQSLSETPSSCARRSAACLMELGERNGKGRDSSWADLSQHFNRRQHFQPKPLRDSREISEIVCHQCMGIAVDRGFGEPSRRQGL